MISAPSAAKRESYFAYIDGLRAVSIIAVVLFHLDPRLLPSGFAGVDVFFVVSGFIISGSLHDRRFSGLLDLFTTFYARRFRRIVPALLFMLIVTCALTVLFVPQGFAPSGDLRQVASSAFLGFSNIRLAFSTNYFFPNAEFDPFTHTWSLAVEEQFYVIFPVIYLLLTTRRTANAALAILVVLCVGSFTYGWFEPRLAINLGFYSSLARFWEIGSGVLLYALLARKGLYRPRVSREIWPLTLAGALLLLAAFIVGSPQTYPVSGALLPVAGALCLIAALHGRMPASIVGKALSSAPMVAIGLISYSLYLWHWPVFSLFRWTIGFTEVWQKALALLIAVAMTLVSYRGIEKPIRHAASLQVARRAIPVFLGLIALLWWGGDRMFANVPYVSLSVVNRHRDDWFGPRAAEVQAGMCRVTVGYRLVEGSSVQDITPVDCGAAGAHGLFAIGDSHTGAYRPMLIEYARRTGAPVTIYSAPCGFPKNLLWRPDCTAVDTAIVADVVRRAGPGDVAFLASLRLPRFRSQWDTFEVDTAAEWRATEARFEPAVNQSVAMLQPMATKGMRVVFELPKPIFRIPLFRCADWFNRNNPACAGGSEFDRAMLLNYRQPVLAFADALKARVNGFSIWDPFPALCPGEVCSMWRDGRPLFFDGDHVTYLANTLLADDFIATITALDKETRPATGAPEASR
jgi:peptidoglycan/LPS O-acetylase OafA/YrhL